jgi:hypothetical protein
MQFAFDDFPLSSTALLYWLSVCSTALLPAAHCDLDRFDSVSAEQAIRKPIKVRSKVRSKVALRFAGAQARNALIVVSTIAE